jgi:hypothetical protein
MTQATTAPCHSHGTELSDPEQNFKHRERSERNWSSCTQTSVFCRDKATLVIEGQSPQSHTNLQTPPLCANPLLIADCSIRPVQQLKFTNTTSHKRFLARSPDKKSRNHVRPNFAPVRKTYDNDVYAQIKPEPGPQGHAPELIIVVVASNT